jgi:hypothetical protein
MATFTNCLQIVNAMPEQDQDALLTRLDELQAQGMSPKEAQLQAAIDVLTQIEQAADPDSGLDSVDIRWSPRREPAPEKTVKAYKLFRVDARQPGKLFPLFVNANEPIDMGAWLDADEGPMQGGKVKSKLGPLAYRPGWHAGDLPIATHIGGKSNAALKKPDLRPDNQVWAEIEMAADVDWQAEATKRGTNADGKLVAVRAHITDQIPVNGFYRYKTNPNMTGNWLIGGSMKVNRILSDAEVERINAAAGVADLQREEPFDAKKYGFKMRKSVDRPQFYSQLQRAIEGVPDRLSNMGALGWKQWIDSNGPKLGVKKEEIEWSGIKDYLDLQGKAKLSKDDLSAYLDDSGVKISEVMSDDDKPKRTMELRKKADAAMDQANAALMDATPEIRQVDFLNLRNWAEDVEAGSEYAEGKIAEMNLTDEQMKAVRQYGRATALYNKAYSANANAEVRKSKYGQYTLPGGENYRELLITLPRENPVAGVSPVQAARVLYGKEFSQLTAEQQAEVKRKIDDDKPSATYMSSHWQEPNVLAHIRINDRADADGKRVLFVEEVQSDWGQEGKKKGFAGDGRAVPDGIGGYKVVDKSGNDVLGKDGQVISADTPAEAMAQVKSGIPSAPFVTKTEGWLNLALKRIAMMAVEGGYNKVAFVNGEQSADRYDLSKQVEEIRYRPNADGTYDVAAFDIGMERRVLSEPGVPLSRIEELVGKDIAKKVEAGDGRAGSDRWKLLTGVDLKVGGEGMKTFYDQIVPQALNKLLPKLGGEKLGAVEIEGQFTDEQKRQVNDAYGRGTRDDVERVKGMKPGFMQQPGFDVTDKMRETVGAGLPLFSRDRQAPDTPAFRKWFGDSKVVDAKGKPLVVYHGTVKSFDEFNADAEPYSYESDRGKQFFLDNPQGASDYAIGTSDAYGGNANVMPVYLRMENPRIEEVDGPPSEWWDSNADALYWQMDVVDGGHDGLIVRGDGETMYVTANPAQIKSATGNRGTFDATNPDIRKAADRPWFEDLSKLKVSTNYQLGDLLKSSKKLSWWDRTVGTQYNLATKQPEFKRVFDAVQSFINDVSAYATRAADMAPTILPKLESFKDIVKQPMTPEDVAALRDPVFGGTLKYARDENGKLIETDDVQKAGVVFTDEELKTNFKLTDDQIGLYRQFRKSVDQSVTDLALSDMVRYLGEDGRDIAETVMASGNVDVAVGIINSHLGDLAREKPTRTDLLESTRTAIELKGDQANRLMDRGYAPLSRFGQYTTYVVGKDGEQLYFGMFENERDAQKMAREMRQQYPDATVSTSTMSQESYKLFSGVTPETLALFGDSLGLEESGIDTKSEVFQQYLKVAKTNRSAMKRLIERKGIDGFSEDAGRVLAGFVYSNARQISTNLHAGEIGKAAADVKDGDVKDAAIRLMEYIQNPQEEAQAIRGLLFTQFIGGSIASALVNMTQPFTMTAPYLAQFDGVTGATRRMGEAMKLATRGVRNDADLQDALKRAEDEGIVSPQEVHQLMAQARGRGSLITGDGTKMGDAAAKANNFTAKLGLAWGKAFSAAEQFNRRITFIAAYKLARDKGIENPFAFAEKTIAETQGIYNKGNKPAWARGAIGGTLFTFKQYSISYVEFLRRMWGNGPEGKKAVGLALGVLFMSAGLGGMPGADDLDDVIDGFAQRVLGKSFDSKQAKKEFFASILGQSGAEFVMTGLTGLPGAPIDLSGRLGLGNLIPGTGIFTKKTDYGRDVGEIFGPAGSLFKQVATGAGKLAQGDVAGAAKEVAPVAAQNVIKAVDMAVMGMYRDTRGRKVIDIEPWEAVAKAVGFQPATVKRVQDATGTQQNLIGQNKLRETEIADKWAAGRIEKNPSKVEEAKAELAEWNRKNPESPISIDASQINRRVQQAMMEKARRLEKTAPKEIRQSVRQELERASN